jgi:dTDP-4-amino-4,6-dideoxygalactose transaminase
MSDGPIPFLDLVTPHVELEEELVAAFRTALRNAAFIGGPAVEGFEKEFAAFCDAKFCVGLASGTDALRFALMAAGIESGDAVITVPNTFIATTEAISQAGARPYFVDIDERTYNMDPAKLRDFLALECMRGADGVLVTNAHGLRVKAIVPVHLYGQMANMDAITEIAEQYGLVVVEDACQAHGAEYFSKKRNAWVKPGAMSFAAAYSFYPGKNLGACGEAGAVTTNNEESARRIKMIRDHGQAKKYYHDIEGYNGRLDAIQASILSIKLKHLSEWTEQRQKLSRKYNEKFAKSSASVVTPYEPEWSRAVYHLYVVRVPDREMLQRELSKVGVGTGIHYPVPLHQQKAYENLGYRTGDFPVTERVSLEIVSLPMFPQLAVDLLEVVCEKVARLAVKQAAVAVG